MGQQLKARIKRARRVRWHKRKKIEAKAAAKKVDAKAPANKVEAKAPAKKTA